MNPSHIDDFFHVTGEVLATLYAAFPVRHLLLVEEISGPIQWDMTGLPDRRSTACFETLVWLAQYGLLDYRTVEPRDIGLEGAVLTQRGFILLTQSISWSGGPAISRIEALKQARRELAYDDIATLIIDLLQTNSGVPSDDQPRCLTKAPALAVIDESNC